MSYTYAYPRPALTVDCVVFGYDHAADDLSVLLIRRGAEPYADRWALPGGFIDIDESADAAARRELEEETGLHDVYLEQLYTFTAPERDPRGRVVSVAYYALVNLGEHAPEGQSDAAEARWFGLQDLPELAFDHANILATAIGRLRAKVTYAPIGFELLPERFTLRDLQRLYEMILGRALDKSNFRKRILRLGLLRDTGRKETDVPHRPARLYELDRATYDHLLQEGYPFEL